MSFLYSPSTGGFYRKGLSKNVPPNAVAVSVKRHAELMAAQAQGAAIVASAETGEPIARMPLSTVEATRARLVREIKREAARRIEAVSPPWRQLNDLRDQSEAGAARFAAIDAIRVASDAIEDKLAVTPDGDLAAFLVADHPHWPNAEVPA